MQPETNKNAKMTQCFLVWKNWWYFFAPIFWPGYVAGGTLVSQLGIEPVPPQVQLQSLNHWATREAPGNWW